MKLKSIQEFNTEKALEAIQNKEKIIFENLTIILASKSISRKRIMEQAGISFVVLPSIVDEEKMKEEFPIIDTEELAVKYVKKLAYEKAKALEDYVENGIIIAADTIAFCDNEKLEKPVDKEDARRILTKISDSRHLAITGVCIIKDGITDNFHETSFVEMDKFEEEKIEELINNPNTYLYAGGYCIDDNIEGYAHVAPADYYNVMGLPLQTITSKLKKD
jgi:septum formation protein